MKHTRGPWIISNAYPATEGMVILDDEGFPVADLDIEPISVEEIEANARLIAAAPELYAALKYMNHMGGDKRGGYRICSRNDGSAPDKKHSTSCRDARAALAKAEGRA